MNTDGEERRKQIRERATRLKWQRTKEDLLASTDVERAYENTINDLLQDIEYLLDDSQADETLNGPCVHCGHNNYDTERKECKQRWMEGQYSVVCGCPCARHNSIANAATAMRDLCVEQVKGLYDEYESLEGAAESIVLSKAVGALESLTLDQVEKKQ